MAQDEKIKIIIDANAEEFAQVSRIINEQLTKMGKNFQIFQKDVNDAAGAMDKFDKSGKKFGRGMTNIALVIQDLPYGLRGIQNNLPALAAGFGGLYLAVSVVTAAMTYFSMEGDKMTGITKKLFDSFKEFVNGVVSDLYNGLKPAFDEVVKAVTYLWNMFGDNIINNFKYAWDTVVNVLKGAGQIVGSLFTTITSALKGDWEGFGNALVNILKRSWNLIIDVLVGGFKIAGNVIGGFTKIFNKNLGDTISKSTAATATDFANRFKFAFKEVDNEYKKLDVFSLFGSKKKTKGKTGKDDTQSKLNKANEVQVQNYLATLGQRDKEEYKAGLELAKDLETLKEAGYTDSEGAYTAYRIKLGEIAKKYDDIEAKRNEDSMKFNREWETKFYNDSNAEYAKLQKEITAKQVYFSEQRIKQTKAEADQSIKANKGNYQAQRDALEQAIAKLTVFMSTTNLSAEAVLHYQEAITGLVGQLEGLVDPLETFNTSLTNIINDSLSSAFVNLGEQLGKSLFQGDGLKVAMDGFLMILADGLIEVGKLAIATGIAIEGIKKALKSLNPYVAVAAGVALVALGTYVKARLSQSADNLGGSGGGGPQKFANGGVISGPTYGLMGEYPGAKSNPEVVAPLSKLKDMIDGGGNGQFVLRGNDLVLALNRSSNSLNLRRG